MGALAIWQLLKLYDVSVWDHHSEYGSKRCSQVCGQLLPGTVGGFFQAKDCGGEGEGASYLGSSVSQVNQASMESGKGTALSRAGCTGDVL